MSCLYSDVYSDNILLCRPGSSYPTRLQAQTHSPGDGKKDEEGKKREKGDAKADSKSEKKREEPQGESKRQARCSSQRMVAVLRPLIHSSALYFIFKDQ